MQKHQCLFLIPVCPANEREHNRRQTCRVPALTRDSEAVEHMYACPAHNQSEVCPICP
jgi:hypothetical protein